MESWVLGDRAISTVQHTATGVSGPTRWLVMLPRRCMADSDRIVYSQASRTAETVFDSSCLGSTTYKNMACMAVAFGSNSRPSSTGPGMGCKEKACDSSHRDSNMEWRRIVCVSGFCPGNWSKGRLHDSAQGTEDMTAPDNMANDSWQRLPIVQRFRSDDIPVARNHDWPTGGGNGACGGGSGDGAG